MGTVVVAIEQVLDGGSDGARVRNAPGRTTRTGLLPACAGRAPRRGGERDVQVTRRPTEGLPQTLPVRRCSMSKISCTIIRTSSAASGLPAHSRNFAAAGPAATAIPSS